MSKTGSLGDSPRFLARPLFSPKLPDFLIEVPGYGTSSIESPRNHLSGTLDETLRLAVIPIVDLELLRLAPLRVVSVEDKGTRIALIEAPKGEL